MKLIVIVAGVLLAGCANLQQALNAGEASALVSVRAAEDNNIKLWTLNACGTPFSAAVRNPQIVAALMDLCMPQGDRANPANLLNGIPR